MNPRFKPLESNNGIVLLDDDDVLLLDKDTFTVKRFKEVVEQEVRLKFLTQIDNLRHS